MIADSVGISVCVSAVDQDLCVRLGGTNKKSYASSMKVLQCLLDLQPKTTVADLCVQFGCTSAKTLANQVLEKYALKSCLANDYSSKIKIVTKL